MRLLCVLGASEALADHLCRHPEHWRELTDPTLGSTRPAAYAVRERLLAAVGADPHDRAPVATVPDAEARRRAARGVPPGPAAAGRPRPGPRPRGRRRRRRALRPRRRHPRGGPGRRPAAGGRDGADRPGWRSIAMGKCGGHELNYVSDVDVIFVLRAGRRRRRRTAALKVGHPARQPPDAGLLGPHRRGHHLAGRRRAAARGQGRPAGPHPRQPPRLLRAVGQDLGVPGAAQGPRRSPATSSSGGSTSTWSSRWCGARPSGTASSRTPRRCAAGSSSTSPPTRPSGSSSSAPAGCATSSSPSSCSSSCTAAPTSGSAQPTTLSALAALTRGGYVGREDGEALHRRLRVPAHPRAPDPALPAAPHPRRARRRGVAAPARPQHGLHQGPGRRPSTTTWQHHRREVRRLHEKLFYRPLLTAVARLPGDEARLTPGGGAAPAGRARLRRPGRRAAAPRGAHRGRHPHRQHPAHAAAGDARLVRRGARPRRRAVRLPPDQRVARPDAVVPQDPARRGRGRRAAGQAARHLALRHRPARERAAGRADAGGGPRPADRRAADRGDARRRRPPRRPRGGGARDPRRTPPRAVPHRGRRRCSASPTSPTSARGCRGSPTRPSRRRSRSCSASVAPGQGARRSRRPGWRSSRWAATAASSCPTAATPTCCSCTTAEDGVDQHEAASYAQAVAKELRRLLALPGGDPPLEVDADLRPEGKQGPLVRSLDSYAAYYAKWSKVWEAQALLRADAVVGRPGPAAPVRGADRPAALPRAGGLSEDDVGGGTPDQGAGRQGAAAARRRPQQPPQARPGRPRRHRVDRAAAPDAARRARCAGLRTSRTLEALDAAREADLLVRVRRRRADRGLADG